MFVKDNQAAFVDPFEGRIPKEGVALNLLRRRVIGSMLKRHNGHASRDIFAFSSPRSGSTMLMSLLDEQPNIQVYDEPLNMLDPVSWHETGCKTWKEITTLQNREEVLGAYFKRLSAGQVTAKNTAFYRRGHKPNTDRCYYKIIHGAEDMAEWFSSEFGGHILLLLRHPIATALSHWILPRLPHYFDNEQFRAGFTSSQVSFVQKAIDDGEAFTMGIVNWCIQNKKRSSQPLGPKWARVSYEELVCDPVTANRYLAQKLNVDAAHLHGDKLRQPSVTVLPGHDETRRLIQSNDAAAKETLINRWREKVTPQQEELAFDILERFEIDYYERGSSLPVKKYRVPADLA